MAHAITQNGVSHTIQNPRSLDLDPVAVAFTVFKGQALCFNHYLAKAFAVEHL